MGIRNVINELVEAANFRGYWSNAPDTHGYENAGKEEERLKEELLRRLAILGEGRGVVEEGLYTSGLPSYDRYAQDWLNEAKEAIDD